MNTRFLYAATLLLFFTGSNVAEEQKTDQEQGAKTTREVCREVPVEQAAPSQDKHKVLGTVGGAAVGGVLGNQVGGGRGKTLATVAGAAAGAVAGRKIQEGQQQKKAQPKTEMKCETVTDGK